MLQGYFFVCCLKTTTILIDAKSVLCNNKHIMNIKEACSTIVAFADEYSIDEFTAIEVMVKNMALLNDTQRNALFAFMDYGK